MGGASRSIRLGARRVLLATLCITATLGSYVPGAHAQAIERSHRSAHFSITWVQDGGGDSPDPTDADSSGVPDAIESVLAAFEATRSFQLAVLGFKPPPVDSRLPLYVGSGSGAGYTRVAPGGSGRSRPSYIIVPPRLVRGATGVEIRAFAAHEYQHAIQNGYDYQEPRWISEATSTWIEDVFDDDADPNHYLLRYFVPYPRRSLTSEADPYGSFLFLQFLTERFDGRSIVRELWELMAVPEAIPGAPDLDAVGALQHALVARGSSLADAWGEFHSWRRHLSRFSQGAAYRAILEGIEWPVTLRRDVVRGESCRLTTDTATGGRLGPLSGDYVVLTRPRRQPAVDSRIAVAGPPGASGFALLRSPAGVTEQRLVFDAAGRASFDARVGRGAVRRIVLGLANGSGRGGGVTIGYSLRVLGPGRVAMSDPSGPGATTFGEGVSLTGSVTCRGAPAAFASVEVTGSGAGGTGTQLVTTDAAGRWQLVVAPTANTRYRARVADLLLSEATSGTVPVDVRVRVTLTAPSIVESPGESFAVTGDLFPAHPGASLVIEYRRPDRGWHVATRVTAGASGYSAILALPGPGVWELRARVTDTADGDHAPGTSLSELVYVRDASV